MQIQINTPENYAYFARLHTVALRLFSFDLDLYLIYGHP